jgi:peptidoglycan/LPS O-acetylase OafA/YrhL
MDSRQNRFEALDGLRGLAIVSVVIHHGCCLPNDESWKLTWNWVIGLGSLGGNLFMMLSGFLIKKSLLKKSGTQSLDILITNHYIQRFFRIYPLYFLALLFVSVVMPVVYELLSGKSDQFYRPSALNFLLYLSLLTNVKVATSNFGALFDVTWTISVLEQFYLFWIPICLSFSNRQLKRICWLLVGLAIVFRVIAAQYSVPYHVFHVLLPFRMDAIALGCLIAIAHTERRLPVTIPSLGIVTIVASATLVASLYNFSGYGSNWRARFCYPILNVVCGLWILISLGCARSSRWIPLLSNRLFKGIGARSYLIYLVHMPSFVFVFVVLRLIAGKPDKSSDLSQWLGVLAGLLNIPVSFLFACVAHILVERPILALRDRLRRREIPNASAPDTAKILKSSAVTSVDLFAVEKPASV